MLSDLNGMFNAIPYLENYIIFIIITVYYINILIFLK